MKRLLAFAFAGFIATNLALAQSTNTKPGGGAEAPPKFTPEQLREDLKIARDALEEGHSGIYRYTKKADLDRIFDEAAKTLDRPMDAFEFYRVLAPVVAAIKCGHTSANLPGALLQEINVRTPLLPLQVRVIDKKPFVFRDFSCKNHDLAGMEIRAINGVPAAKIVATMLAAVTGDGDVESARQVRIGDLRFNSLLVALLGLKSPYEGEFWSPKTKSETKARLEGIELPKLKEMSKSEYPLDQRPGGGGDFQSFDDGRIGLMTIYGFGGANPKTKKTVRDLYKEAFEELQAKGAKALIIDLRGNGGGEDALGKLLLSHLIDQPFKYYDDLVINNDTFAFSKYTAQTKFKVPEKFAQRGDDGKWHGVGHPNWGINQPSKPTFAGKVFILIDGGSFSTTSEFLSQAHFHKRAVFIGEESAGGYYGNSSGMQPTVNLPNTKLRVPVPLVTYYMAVKGYKDAARGVIPDHPIPRTIEDMLSGTDREMELALKLARQ
ncbi:MAG: hypothetical protein HY040_16835 [Planctomycetes bacterium]|nr:hypothetical protein [Planctomycetota bacterium]